MTPCVAYTCVSQGPISHEYAAHFVATWMEFPPGVPTDLMVICNGGPLRTELALIFSPLAARFFPRVNDGGRDITGYQDAATGPLKDRECVLWAGESVYFHRAGWMARFVEVWQRIGPGLYGPFSSNALNPHLNSTCFCCEPGMLRRWPDRPRNKADRYAFEHGRKPFWRFVQGMGYPVRLVTWDGDWSPRLWREPPNILWKGTQENVLVYCNHTQRYFEASETTKARWSKLADSPYR
jgi:hypothetical protein